MVILWLARTWHELILCFVCEIVVILSCQFPEHSQSTYIVTWLAEMRCSEAEPYRYRATESTLELQILLAVSRALVREDWRAGST